MSALVRYDAARHALSIAHSVDEVKDIRDKAQAMAAYARQANDTQLVEWATEIKVRAERKAGEMLAAMGKNKGGRPSKTHDIVSSVSTLADIGVSPKQSERWQKLAAVSDDKFELAVAAAKEVAGEVTTAAMLRVANGKTHPAASRPAKLEIVPVAKLEALEKKYATLSEKYDELLAELETCEVLRSGDAAKEMNTLRQSLAQANRARDECMRTASQMRKQIDALTRELKKLGWKGFKK